MKKIIALFTLATLLAACVRELQPEIEDTSEAPKTYSFAIEASKANDNGTKGLDLDGSTLNAYWADGESVTAYNVTKDAALGGTLVPQETGTTITSTILSGSLTGTIEPNDELTLKFLSPTYTSQDGTLDYIASNCDYAEATVHVNTVDDGGHITIKESYADFQNKQTIIKFTLKNATGDALPSNPSALRVTDGTNTIIMTGIPGTTYTTNGNGVLFIAMPGFTDKTFTLDAYCGDKLYTYSKADVSFANSSYHTATVRMAIATTINLANVLLSIELHNGSTVTGTLGRNVKISVANNATVTLNGISINSSGSWTSGNYAGITCAGNATIILADGTTNTVKGFNSSYPGVSIPSGYLLTIQGTGTLNASSRGNGAGIGGGATVNCGNILVKNGTINATGGINSAGIGSGRGSSCGTIEIQNGTVTAQGGISGAGIGSGAANSDDANSTCGNITISGGDVIARGGSFSAGIGSGPAGDGDELMNEDGGNSSCGDITISGGTVDARGSDFAAGIGSGRAGNNDSWKHGGDSFCGVISISGGTVNAQGGSNGAGIGSGSLSDEDNAGSSTCSNISISGGTVIATGGNNSAGIGTGSYSSCGAISITADISSVTAIKGTYGVNCIGHGEDGTSGTVAIGSATVYSGSAWTPNPMVAGQYGGMRLAISTTSYSNDTWTLTPIAAPASVTAIDLGLPSGTLWASCNVGGTNPGDFGDYFAWGEVEPYYSSQNPFAWKAGKTGYNWDSYRYGEGGYYSYEYTVYKYNDTDNITVLLPEDDAATYNWGNDWCMPTRAQWEELLSNCVGNMINGVYRLQSNNNSNYIDFPAAGYIYNTSHNNTPSSSYWSSTLDSTSHGYAWSLSFSEGEVCNSRFMGFSVRPVRAPIATP